MLKYQMTVHGRHGAKYHVYAPSYTVGLRMAADRYNRINKVLGRGVEPSEISIDFFGRDKTVHSPEIRTIRTW